jgi:hypothetical protein
MPMTSEKIYKIDDRPVSPKELIDFASETDGAFNALFVKTTSNAATILMAHGYSVTENKDK